MQASPWYAFLVISGTFFPLSISIQDSRFITNKLPASIVCNFQNYLFTTAKQQCLAPKGSIILSPASFGPHCVLSHIKSKGTNTPEFSPPRASLPTTHGCHSNVFFFQSSFMFSPHGFSAFLVRNDTLSFLLLFFSILNTGLEITYIFSLCHI